MQSGFRCSTLGDLVDVERLAAEDVDLAGEALTDGDARYSWAEYADRVARFAGALLGAGVTPGDRVAIHLTKSVHSFVAVHAVLRAGGVVVPVDPLAPVDHAVGVVADAGAGVVVTDSRPSVRGPLVEALGPSAVLLPSGEPDGTDAGRRWIGADEIAGTEPIDLVAVDPDDPAYIIYTSGSTGRPKGIVHTHRSALAYAAAAADAYGLDPHDRLLNIAPLHFDQSTFELYAAPYVGAAAIVVPDPVLRFPASVAERVEIERPTVWYSVPLLLMQLSERGGLERRDLSSLRWILFGGESFPPGRLTRLMEQLPAARFSNVYGPAEVNQCTAFEVTEPPVGDDPIPIGRAWPAADIRIVDDEVEPVDPTRVVEPGVPGVAVVSSPTMMTGYWNRPDLTAAAIVTEPGDPVRRWYVTGDLVVEADDGELVFLGRVDNQIKLRGHRVELEAVDAALRDVAGVTEAIAVVDRRRELDQRIVALVVPVDPDDAGLRDRIAADLGRRLPRYSVPADVVIVDRLPLTGTGKVDRRAAGGMLP